MSGWAPPLLSKAGALTPSRAGESDLIGTPGSH